MTPTLPPEPPTPGPSAEIGAVDVASSPPATRETSSSTLRHAFTSDPADIAAVRKSVEAFAATHGLGERAVADLGLCVNEAVANVIRHAYGNERGRPIELDVDATDAGIEVVLRDWGNGRVPDLNTARDPLDLRPGGLGLPCMKHLLDGVHFEPQPDGMRLRLTKLKRKT